MKKGSTAQCVCLVDESCNWTMRPCLSSDVKLHPKPISVFSMAKVFSEPSQKWYEPEWWKFGDKKLYFRHASGEMYVISQGLAKFV
ncbi:hydroxyproline O-galactosyltransferase HPGT1-like isoform X2 [Rosa rugosa]|uniref:hydroxyproline O-galactosyltransferase HPGT1-like isoform X2 n=1 Tax=Rosa rugosa TaxID=74645 RepID=UPI002B402045|nr:hydroxyproline O-galactosyltransferase HPGT1-like isoform X2 [Rosa rugosa]